LNLSSDEWRQFFSLRDDDGSKSDTASVSTLSPILRPVGGCDIPYLSFKFPQDVSGELNLKDTPEPWGKCFDCLGQMDHDELNKFRTTWCCKRYDHNHALCRFAHVETNQGWLRRNPAIVEYSDIMCPHTTVIKSSSNALVGCHLNTCPDGVNCKYAHSKEEIDYHPKRYKTVLCQASKPLYHNCCLCDICPKTHPESPRSPIHGKSRSGHGKRVGDNVSRGKGAHHGSTKHGAVEAGTTQSGDNLVPASAPIIYHNPAPLSEFEKTLMFPGLQILYRKNCAVHYAYYVKKSKSIPEYSNFGDSWEDVEDLIENNEANNKYFSFFSS